MKNLHILPTDKPSRLWLSTRKENYLIFDKFPRGGVEYVEPKNIYITSDEEIKEGDWCYNLSSKSILKADSRAPHWFSDCKKITLTTDQDLIKDGVQSIDDDFLEWFVKNPSCEEIEVKCNYVCSNCNEDKNNPKYENCHGNYRTHKIFKIIIPKEEPKQETLEEAAERLYPTTINSFTDSGFDMSETERLIFINGVKWQQEQEQNNENSWFNEYQKVEDYIIKRIGDKFLEATPEKYNTASEATIALLENNWQQEQNKKLYSEEEVLRIITECKSYLSFGDEFDEIEWFEQFKKK